MKVVVVANDGDGDDGFVGERFAEYGAGIDRRWRESPGALDDAEIGADAIVLLGSDWSVYQPSVTNLVAAEKALILRAVERGVPLLGICFGAQIAAAAFGCAVVRAERAEIGWRSLSSDSSAFSAGPWFQYHADRWIDAGRVHSFMYNSIAPQAFDLGRILAVQFHPEVTAPTSSRWLHVGADEVAAAGESIELIESATNDLIDGARDRCRHLVEYFVDVIGSRSPTGLRAAP